MKRIFLFLFVLGVNQLGAQDFGFGFRAGLNQSTIRTDNLESDSNSNGETLSNNSGFNIAAAVNLKLTSEWGLRTEFLFVQKGARRKFEGTGYQIFFPNLTEPRYAIGDKTFNLRVSTSYIELPLLVTYKPEALKFIEFGLGAYGAFRTGAIGAGELIFSGKTLDGKDVDQMIVNLDYNYGKDEARGIGSTDEPDITTTIDGFPTVIPGSWGAFYEYEEGSELSNLYNFFDAGLTGSIAIYVNSGLFLRLTYDYGLLDVTNKNTDLQLGLSDNEQKVFRDDIDYNRMIQMSVGFSF